MKRVSSWNDFKYVIKDINNLDQFDFDGDKGQIIKKVVEVYGEKLPELYEKYGKNIFENAYTSDERLVETVGDLERKLITDFHDNFKKMQNDNNLYICSFETFQKAVENGSGIFEKEIENLFSKNYPDDILKIIYRNGNLKVYPYTKDFIKIMQTVDFEDYRSFLNSSVTNY